MAPDDHDQDTNKNPRVDLMIAIKNLRNFNALNN